MIEIGLPTIEYKTEVHFNTSIDIIKTVERFSEIDCRTIGCSVCPFNGKFESDFKDTNGIKEGCLVGYMAVLSTRLHPERIDK